MPFNIILIGASFSPLSSLQVLMFWVTDNFLMKKPKRGRKRTVRYQRVGNNNGIAANLPEDSDALLSGDEDLLDSTEDPATTPLAFKNVDELLNVNRRNNSVVWTLLISRHSSILFFEISLTSSVNFTMYINGAIIYLTSSGQLESHVCRLLISLQLFDRSLLVRLSYPKIPRRIQGTTNRPNYIFSNYNDYCCLEACWNKVCSFTLYVSKPFFLSDSVLQ